jgi:peptide/nickel transport system substrate-binding protein
VDVTDERQRRIDAVRGRIGEAENHLVDELRAGRINRREFIRRGTVLGMSVTALGVLSGCSRPDVAQVDPPQTKPPRPGGTIRVGMTSPAGKLDPVTVADEGGLGVLGQSGEYLVWSDDKLNAVPRLAERWSHNGDGTVWTFKIRQGVRFHDGTPLTAEDVATTMNRLADPKVGSNALSTFAGALSKGNTKAVDQHTVEFHLDAPNGNFPYLVSSDNYNAIILPKTYDGDWEKTFIGTGPWVLDHYSPNEGVTYNRNPHYWRGRTVADRNELKFYPEEQAQVLGLQGNQVDVLIHYSVSAGKALITDPDVRTIQFRSASHRQVHMRTDKEPFKDKRVRQAMGLLIDRRALVQGLLATKSDYGNDSPFAPDYKSTDRTVPQRRRDIAKAKELLRAAGKADGFTVQLNTLTHFELPDLAQVIQDNASAAGIKIHLQITDAGTYYGDAVYGKSPWLDSTMGITDYGHRGVPNVYLTAPLGSKGTWNAAHFKNPTYDGLVKDYIGTLDLQSQRQVARKIQLLLLDETPIIFPYFYFFLTGAANRVSGVETTAMGHADLFRTGLVAA